MDYDTDALTEIALLGDVLAAAAHARSRIAAHDLDRVLQVSPGRSVPRRPAHRSRRGRPPA